MMENVRISGWQFFLLVFNFTVGTAFFLRTGGMIAAAKQDAWLIPLWAGSVGVLTACLWLALVHKYPGLSIVQICMQAGGKYVGGLIAFMYILFFIQIASWVTRNLGDFMKDILMPRTPISVFHLMFLVLACYATIKGVQSIARVNEFLTPIVTLMLFVICLCTLTEWSWDRFQPIFQLNVWETMKETRSIMGFPYFEVVSIMMLVPYVKRRMKTGLLLGIGMATLLLSGIIFLTIGVLGVTRASHFTYPVYIIAQELQIASFVERVDTTIVIIWLIWIFIKLCVVFYSATAGICQLFQVKDRTWIALPLILLISGLAITSSENVVANIEWDRRYMFELGSLYGIILPSLLICLSWFRHSGKTNRRKAL